MKLPEIPGSIIAQMATVPAMKNPSKLAEKGMGGASEIATAIRYQHDAEYEGPDSTYANLVYLSLALLRQEGIGSGPLMPIPDSLLQRLQLSEADAVKVLHKVLDARDALKLLVHNFQAE